MKIESWDLLIVKLGHYSKYEAVIVSEYIVTTLGKDTVECNGNREHKIKNAGFIRLTCISCLVVMARCRSLHLPVCYCSSSPRRSSLPTRLWFLDLMVSLWWCTGGFPVTLCELCTMSAGLFASILRLTKELYFFRIVELLASLL